MRINERDRLRDQLRFIEADLSAFNALESYSKKETRLRGLVRVEGLIEGLVEGLLERAVVVDFFRVDFRAIISLTLLPLRF